MPSQLQSNGKKGNAGSCILVRRCCVAAPCSGEGVSPFTPKLGRRRSTALPSFWEDGFVVFPKSAFRIPHSAIRLLCSAVLLAFLVIPSLHAQVNYLETNVIVKTIGGGPPYGAGCGSPAGLINGNTISYSQFDGPVAMALNSQNTLYIADKTNNAVRAVSEVGNTGGSVTSSALVGLTNVVGVAVDAADSLYVLTQSNGPSGRNVLRKYNYSFNLIFSNALPYTPAAMAVSQDAFNNIFIAFTNGIVLEYTQSGSALLASNTILAAGSQLKKPAGIAWRTDGVLAVSDLGNNAIYLLAGTNNSVPVLYAGGGPDGQTRGWVDGAINYAEFNQPLGLTWSPDNQLIVADRMNNAVRRVDASGVVSTVYGVNSNLWGPTECQDGIYAGYVDGTFGATNGNATGDAPASVLIAPSGTIYVTELHYDLLREVTGVTFNPTGTVTTGTNSTGGTNSTTNVVILPPTFSPNSGYFPECQTISVTSPTPSVYYTTDGTIPTTNSQQVLNMMTVLTNGRTIYEGTFQYCNSMHDLTFLHLIAASGTNVSAVTNGMGSPISAIGFPSPRLAGSGSTAVIPLVVNLQSNTSLASLQFRLEITPTTAATPAIATVHLLPITTNDFVQIVGPAPGDSPVLYQTLAYPLGFFGSNSLDIAISAVGNSSGLSVQSFAVLAMLEIPIPPTAVEGQSYSLSILYPSGTSDGAQGTISLSSMPVQTLTVSNVQYFVGDSSPSGGYDAGEFGDGTLNNADVNNALLASVGIHVPYTFSDAFSAMDVFPETTSEIGDGFITFLDWQHILLRSLGGETNNWVRFWTNGGVLSHKRIAWAPGQTVTNGVDPTPSSATTGSRAVTVQQPGVAWLRQASIHAGTVVQAANTVSIPVSINVLPGYSLSGLQFRATLVADGSAPTPGQIQFTPAAGLPSPYATTQGLTPNDIICAWSLFQPFTPALQGSNLLGSITFQVPRTAQAGQSYTLHFSGVDGSPDLNTIYQLEGVPGSAWVASPALAPAQITSDDWRMYFFGSLTNAAAQDNADPDGDGIPNWQEYLAGTSPTNAASVFNFSTTGRGAGTQNLNLSWQTVPGRTYILESSPAVGGTNWTPVGTNVGDGNAFQVFLTNHAGIASFYRIRILQP